MAEKHIDIYLTDNVKGQRLHFPITPDRLNVKTGAMTVAFTVIGLGEVKIPRGSQLKGFSWNGVFPDESQARLSFVYEYAEPKTLIELLEGWQKNGTTLTLMVTELSINTDVFVETFTYDFAGMGQANYSIGLTTRRQLTITSLPPPVKPAVTTTTGPANATVVLSDPNGSLNVRKEMSTTAEILGKLANGSRIHVNQKIGNWYEIPWATGVNGLGYVQASYVRLDGQDTSRTTTGSGGYPAYGSSTTTTKETKPKTGTTLKTPSGSTYTVKAGDSLYTIAVALLGDGSRWREIYELNKAVIDAANKGKAVSQYTISSGLEFQIPEKKASTSTTSGSLFQTVKTVATNKLDYLTEYAATMKPSTTIGKTVQSMVVTGLTNLKNKITTSSTSVNSSTQKTTTTTAKVTATTANSSTKATTTAKATTQAKTVTQAKVVSVKAVTVAKPINSKTVNSLK